MPPSARPRAVEVVAHRGSAEAVPEHTLAAYRTAVEEGADVLECDVRLTSDGVPVCVHDRRLPPGVGLPGPVSTLELTDLHGLDVSVRSGPCGPAAGPEAPDREAYGVLTLERLLAYVVDCGRRVGVAVETKHPTRYAGLVERRVVEVLDRFGLAHPRLGTSCPVRVMSFSWLGLRRVRQLAPSLGTVLLLARVPLRLRDGSLPRGVQGAGVSLDIVRAHPGYVARAHRHGHDVHVWTVDEEADVDLCAALGVDAIITNRPGAVRTRLEVTGHRPGAGPAGLPPAG